MSFDVKRFEAPGTFHETILSKLEPESNQLLEIISMIVIHEGRKPSYMIPQERKQPQNMRRLYRTMDTIAIMCQ